MTAKPFGTSWGIPTYATHACQKEGGTLVDIAGNYVDPLSLVKLIACVKVFIAVVVDCGVIEVKDLHSLLFIVNGWYVHLDCNKVICLVRVYENPAVKH